MTQNLKRLTREQILEARDIEEREVPVPQWGGTVLIRTLSQKQSRELRAKATRTNPITRQTEIDNDLLESMLFIEGVVDPAFTMADYGRLQDKSMATMSAVLKAIMEASGLSEEAVRGATKSDENGREPEV